MQERVRIFTFVSGHGETVVVEFPTKSGHGVKLYSACSCSAGDTYPSDECRRRVL